MKKYHVATGDGKAYYGVGYESYREAEGVLKISQMHDPQAHIVEEEYHYTNADRIRAMSDEEFEKAVGHRSLCCYIQDETDFCDKRESCGDCIREWLKKPAEVADNAR